MSREHLSEIELMELVEGDLHEAEEASARAHVAACQECSESLAGLEQARAVLRAAPMLELPEPRFHELLDRLPAQDGEETGWRSALARRRRWLVVLAPAAAVVVAVVLAVSLDGPGGGDDEAAAPAPAAAEEVQALQAEAAQDSAAPGEADAGGAGSAEPAEPPAQAPAAPAAPAASAPAPEESAARETIRSVAGTPEEVAERLRQLELKARAVDSTVEVEGADPDVVAEALEGLPDGDVAVVVIPTP
jgi:anti-sigma factor RsiW